MKAPPRHPTRHRGITYRNGSDDPRASGPRRYIVWYTDSDGKAHTETLPVGASEKDALARQAELRQRKSRGERVVVTNLTLGSYADMWLEWQKVRLRPNTIAAYTYAIEGWIKPELGRRKLSDVQIDDVARLISVMQRKGRKAWTIRGVLTPLSRIMATAMRQGYVTSNPVKGLDKSERPKSDQRKMLILSSSELGRVIESAPANHRTLLATLAFTGMRIGEALALRWADVDFEGRIAVRSGKTENASREIVLMASLAELLRGHHVEQMVLGLGRPEDLVFCSRKGTPLLRRNVLRRGLRAALTAANAADESGSVPDQIEAVTLHELRHTFASMLIGQGLDVTFVADQLGHSDPAITLRVYAKLFDPSARRDEARARLEESFGGLL